MNMRRITTGLLIGVMGSATTASAQGADRSTIEGVQQAFQAAVQAWDLDGWAALFTDDTVMLTPFAQTIVGRDAFRRYWAKAWEGRQGSGRNPLSLTRKGILEGDDLAVVRLDYGPEGGNAVGQYVWTLVRERGGQWRIAWWVFTRPPPRPPRNG